MRLYVKLLVTIALFVVAARVPSRQIAADLAYDMRVAVVCHFGNAEDFERLLDDTQRALAAQRGETDIYLRGKRVEELFTQRIAVAECVDGRALSDLDVARIREECEREAFAQPALDTVASR